MPTPTYYVEKTLAGGPFCESVSLPSACVRTVRVLSPLSTERAATERRRRGSPLVQRSTAQGEEQRGAAAAELSQGERAVSGAGPPQAAGNNYEMGFRVLKWVRL